MLARKESGQPPDDDNYRLLTANTAAYENVWPLQAALWGESTRLALENPGRSTDSAVVRNAGTEESRLVRAVTVDEILRIVGASKVDLLKLDIEGAERDVFEASVGVRWLDDVDVIMIETHDRLRPGCSSAFYRAICGHDFDQEVAGEVIAVKLGARRPAEGSARREG